MEKPRLYKCCWAWYNWVCEGKHVIGRGKTPQYAYRDWYARMQLTGKIK